MEKAKEKSDDAPIPPNLSFAQEEEEGHRSKKGLALSGGGIRSAAFACGGILGLGAWLTDLQHISSVSGGGFTASAFVEILRRERKEDHPEMKSTTATALVKLWNRMTKGHTYLMSFGSVKKGVLSLLLIFLALFSPLFLLAFEVAYGWAVGSVFLPLVNFMKPHLDLLQHGHTNYIIFSSFVVGTVCFLILLQRLLADLSSIQTGRRRLWLYASSEALSLIAFLLAFGDLLFTVVLFYIDGLFANSPIDCPKNETVDSIDMLVLFAGLFAKMLVYMLFFTNVFIIAAFAAFWAGFCSMRIHYLTTAYPFCSTGNDKTTILAYFGCAAAAVLLEHHVTVVRAKLYHTIWRSKIAVAFLRNASPPLLCSNPHVPEFHCVTTANMLKMSPSDTPFHLVSLSSKEIRFFFEPQHAETFKKLEAPDDERQPLKEHHNFVSFTPGVMKKRTPSQIKMAEAVALSSAALGFEMGIFGDRFGGKIRRALQYIFGIGLGNWISLREKQKRFTFPLNRYLRLNKIEQWSSFVCAAAIIAIALLYHFESVGRGELHNKWFNETMTTPIVIWSLMLALRFVLLFFPNMRKFDYFFLLTSRQSQILELLNIIPIWNGIHQMPKALFLTDGGHIENLGLFPLLHQECTDIVMLDAEADQTCSSLRQALQMGRNILQCVFYKKDTQDIEAEINKFEQEEHEAYFEFNVCYASGVTGHIRYIKARLPKEMQENSQVQLPYGVCCQCTESCCGPFCRSFSPHPQHTTGNQFFTLNMFEFYAALSFHLVRRHLFEVGSFGNEFNVEFERIENKLMRLGAQWGLEEAEEKDSINV